ncbi:MAG: hypothetical protein QOG48_1820 [Verrucomicrobiota bacterium]|jgi:phenylacetate-CoA ligase
MAATDVFSTALRQFCLGQQPGVPSLDRVRRERLRGLLRHVIEHVPLYRDLYRAHGIDIGAIESADDLWRLPAVSKGDYLRVGRRGYTHDAEGLLNSYTQSTSGSIGQSLTMYADADEAQMLLANLWAGWVGNGVSPKDRLFMMSAPYLAERVPNFDSVFIPVSMKMDEIVARFQSFAPTVVVGMVESIALLAMELQRRDMAERRGVRVLFAFGQTYTEQLRRMLSSGFDGEVFILYGSAEGGWIGYECAQHCGLHVPEGRVVAQIARTGRPDEPAAPNETGELILTSLLRRTTPFIRYRLFDACALDPAPCPCGRNSPRVVNLEGRVQDFLVAADGHWVGPGTVAIDLMINRPAIIDYRLVQEEPARVRVSLVLNPALPPIDRNEIAAVVRRHLGPIEVAVAFVDEIPREASGKRRRVFRMFDLPN